MGLEPRQLWPNMRQDSAPGRVLHLVLPASDARPAGVGDYGDRHPSERVTLGDEERVVVQLSVTPRPENSHDIERPIFVAMRVDVREKGGVVAKGNARFGRHLADVEPVWVRLCEREEGANAATIVQPERVEIEQTVDSLRALPAHPKPATARALQGVHHEVDAHFWHVRAPAVVEHPILIVVEGVAVAAAQVSALPRGSQLAVLLAFLGLRLVEWQALVELASYDPRQDVRDARATLGHAARLGNGFGELRRDALAVELQ